MNSRPPIGFVVEGHGEYNCYPSLFCRISKVTGIKVPVVNAGGCGNIIRRLGEQLTDLVMADSPENVIVTLDLKDALHQGFVKNKVELIELVQTEIERWRKAASEDTRLNAMPNKIACVIQVQKFESWLIADIGGLMLADLVKPDVVQLDDVESVGEPVSWLKSALKCNENIKSPQFARKIISAIDPERMKNHSKSFSYFFTECEAIYRDWEAKLS